MDSEDKAAELSDKIPALLTAWFDENARVLPWREDPLPYHVWVSEIMLQQTRVEAVKPYYARFMKALPDIRALAACPEDRLLKLWEGLGYYNRVRNMQKAARLVVEKYGGQLPRQYEKLLALPGIGSYTAGAIASIAYGQAVPAVDGNVLRVVSRLTENEDDISKQSVKKEVEEALKRVMSRDCPGTFNQALMELGALVCVPNGPPACERCPLRCFCRACQDGRQTDFPVKAGKKPRRIEECTVLVIRDRTHAAICRRAPQGLLAGLYELPSREGRLTRDEALSCVAGDGFSPIRIRPLAEAKHVFSHVEWHMTGYLVVVENCDAPCQAGGNGSAADASHMSRKNGSVAATSRKNGSVAAVSRKDGGVPDILFLEPERIRRDYPIPSAFAAYRQYLFCAYDSLDAIV
ncbi:MAG: A/G-specific adenine glycosylase [Lachnospiraceae bacterium]|nr:A/G-specific adenine glycosylase [Lachnospiraceae bacterium]